MRISVFPSVSLTAEPKFQQRRAHKACPKLALPKHPRNLRRRDLRRRVRQVPVALEVVAARDTLHAEAVLNIVHDDGGVVGLGCLSRAGSSREICRVSNMRVVYARRGSLINRILERKRARVGGYSDIPIVRRRVSPGQRACKCRLNPPMLPLPILAVKPRTGSGPPN